MNNAKKVTAHPLPSLPPCGGGLGWGSVRRTCIVTFFLASGLWSILPGLYAQTELGSEDDLTVLGTNGTAADPDVEIKGFTVFGSTQAAYTGAAAGPGNVVINGVISISSGVYFVGNSTFTNAGKIFINDGSSGQVLRKGALGSLTWDDISALGDNLGSHAATTTLNIAAFNIVGVSTITVSSITTTGAGVVFSTNVYFMNGNVGIGTTGPTHLIHLAGGVYCDGTGDWIAGSDLAYKKEVDYDFGYGL